MTLSFSARRAASVTAVTEACTPMMRAGKVHTGIIVQNPNKCNKLVHTMLVYVHKYIAE